MFQDKLEKILLMSEVKAFSFVGFFLVFFVLMIIGTKLRWKILVDPPESWKGYSHTIMKKLFDTDFLIFYNYIAGFLGTITAIVFFIMLLKD